MQGRKHENVELNQNHITVKVGKLVADLSSLHLPDISLVKAKI